jgi:hypothetical protein
MRDHQKSQLKLIVAMFVLLGAAALLSFFV